MSQEATPPASPGIEENALVKTKERDIITQRRYIKYLSAELAGARARFDGALAQCAERASAFGAQISTQAGRFFGGEREDSDRELVESSVSTSAHTALESFIVQNERLSNSMVAVEALQRRVERATAKLARLKRKRAEELERRRADLLESFAERHVGLTREQYAKARIVRLHAISEARSNKLESWDLYRSRAEGETAKNDNIYSVALNLTVGVELDGKMYAEDSLLHLRESLMAANDAARFAEYDGDAWREALKESFDHEHSSNEAYIVGRSRRARHIVQLEQNLDEINALAFKVRRLLHTTLRTTLRAGRATDPLIKSALDRMAKKAGVALKRALAIAARARPADDVNSGESQRQSAYAEHIASAKRAIAQMERFANRLVEINALEFKVRRLRTTLRASRATAPTIKRTLNGMADNADVALERALAIAARPDDGVLFGESQRQSAYAEHIASAKQTIARMERFATREVVDVVVVDGE